MMPLFGLTSAAILLLKRARCRRQFATSTNKLPFLLQSFHKNIHQQSSLCICTGNQAGDLDSIVSAIGIAYLKNALNTNSNSTTLTLPLLPFPRSEFRLRRDALFLFNLIGFNLDNATNSPLELLFLDDLETLPNVPVELILTDHNSRTLQHSYLQYAHVIEIIDHHTDSKDHPKVTGKKRNVVSGLGSACTLVAESLMEAEEQGLCQLPLDLCVLLMATIELDSRQWNPSRSGARDRIAYDALRSRLLNIPIHLDSLYQQTTSARQDVSGFSYDDLLKLDYKDCGCGVAPMPIKCGIASIMATYNNINQNTSHADLETSMIKFAKENDKELNIVIGFFAKEKKSGIKHLIVCDTNDTVSGLSLSFVEFLQAVPHSLSVELKKDPIMTKQTILQKGVVVQETVPLEISKRTYLVQVAGIISRKALKPITEEWMLSIKHSYGIL